ncbi:MAG: YhjD/YihY/BrkB family envelope integrity protein, partial [Nitrospiraceae bacterium]
PWYRLSVARVPRRQRRARGIRKMVWRMAAPPEIVLEALTFVLSFAVIAGLFAMMFKMLPDAHISWNDVWVGAVITAFLFTVGKFAIGL